MERGEQTIKSSWFSSGVLPSSERVPTSPSENQDEMLYGDLKKDPRYDNSMSYDVCDSFLKKAGDFNVG